MVSVAVPWLVMLAITGVFAAAFPLVGVLAVASAVAVAGGKLARR